jgi:hypothetical protein
MVKVHLRWNYPLVNIKVCSKREENFVVVRFVTRAVQETRFRFWWGINLTKTSWNESPTKASMYESQGMSRYIKNPWHRQVSNLCCLRATDFDSVVATSWPRPVSVVHRRNYPWVSIKVRSKRKKPCCRRVSNLSTPREPAFESVAVSTWPRPVDIAGWTSNPRPIHECLSRCDKR